MVSDMFPNGLVDCYQMVSDMFPNGLALVDNSPYADAIRVIKKKQTRTKAAKAPSDSFQARIKELIPERLSKLSAILYP